MKEIRWDPLKNERLKKTRGVSFEEILQAEFIEIGEHPKRKNQLIMYYLYGKHVLLVPFVETDEDLFLKTLYPSRRHTRIYKERGEIL